MAVRTLSTYTAAADDATPPGRTGHGCSPAGHAALSWPFLVSLALLVGAFAPTLAAVGRTWWENPEYSHGLIMPMVGIWLLWERRDRLRALGPGTSLLAVPLLLLCVAGKLVGELDYMNSLAPFAFVGALGSVFLAFLGWHGCAVLLPALVVLALACPLPVAVLEALTLPLKEVSSQFAVGLLQISGIPTVLEGSMIHLEGTDSLWVADACSGIRSFISLLTLAMIACLLWQRHWAIKLAVVLAAIPIAIFVNAVRIWMTGFLSVHVSAEAASGAFHFFEGFALFAVAGLLLLAFAGLIGLLFPRPTS